MVVGPIREREKKIMGSGLDVKTPKMSENLSMRLKKIKAPMDE